MKISRPARWTTAGGMLAITWITSATAAPQDWKLNPRASLPSEIETLAVREYPSGSQGGAAALQGRTGSRMLYSFESTEDGQPIRSPRPVRLDLSGNLDYGVTHGKKSARATSAGGTDYSEVRFRAPTLRGWADYEYLAVDVYTEAPGEYALNLELRDRRSKNYYTRCTQTQTIRKGQNTILFPIKWAVRNGKEGLDWNQLLPRDKIDRENLTDAKLFFTPPRDTALRLWFDNIRLLQEDAAVPRMRLPLPATTIAAYDFGSSGRAVPGFTPVPVDARFTPESGFGFTGHAELAEGGSGWPDLLGGTFIHATRGHVMCFERNLPNGEYLVWLCAGKIITPTPSKLDFVLRVNDQMLYKKSPTWSEYDGTNYLYRFMWTQYSQRPHALWLDYIQRMYEVFPTRVTVTDGRLVLVTRNIFVSGLVILPDETDPPSPGEDATSDDFEIMAAKFASIRMQTFEGLTPQPERRPGSDKGDYIIYVPDAHSQPGPGSLPSSTERKRTELVAAGTRGQNVIMRIAVRPARDLGQCRLKIENLKGPNDQRVPANAVEGFFDNYRYSLSGPTRGALLPTLALHCEPDITQCFWLWLHIPEDTPPGQYRGHYTFSPGKGRTRKIPVTLTVYPFDLEPALPCAFGMYYQGRLYPSAPANRADAVMRAQLIRMRELGFTTTTIPQAYDLRGMNRENGTVDIRFREAPFQAARAAGLGANEGQPLLVEQLGIARAIARRLPGSRGVKLDREPGIEMKQPEFKPLWISAMKQFKAFLDETKLPYAVEVIDEPREVPNPWNRNLADTITYGQWMGEIGLRRFVTPMGDRNNGRDYVPLVEHTDIVSIHGPRGSSRLLAKAIERNKTLWFYNIGMSRFEWGFFPWAHDATGRFEWHWCFVDQWRGATGGYPGRDWHNPFTPMHGMAPNAPISDRTPGGFLLSAGLLQASAGISDYHYIYTLERRIQATSDASAQKLLSVIRNETRQNRRKFVGRWRASIGHELNRLHAVAADNADIKLK